jgi:hypothetical protein
MDWQPIETAPKDGTRILAYSIRRQAARSIGRVRIMYRHANNVCWMSDTKLPYRDEDIGGWMPLPKPPQLETRG